MKTLKKLILIFVLFFVYSYVVSIDNIPENIIIFKGEDINIITEDVFYDMIQFEKPTSGENESAESYWPSFKMTEEEANEWSEMMTKEYIDNLPADKAKYIQKKIDEGTLKIY